MGWLKTLLRIIMIIIIIIIIILLFYFFFIAGPAATAAGAGAASVGFAGFANSVVGLFGITTVGAAVKFLAIALIVMIVAYDAAFRGGKTIGAIADNIATAGKKLATGAGRLVAGALTGVTSGLAAGFGGSSLVSGLLTMAVVGGGVYLLYRYAKYRTSPAGIARSEAQAERIHRERMAALTNHNTQPITPDEESQDEN